MRDLKNVQENDKDKGLKTERRIGKSVVQRKIDAKTLECLHVMRQRHAHEFQYKKDT